MYEFSEILLRAGYTPSIDDMNIFIMGRDWYETPICDKLMKERLFLYLETVDIEKAREYYPVCRVNAYTIHRPMLLSYGFVMKEVCVTLSTILNVLEEGYKINETIVSQYVEDSVDILETFIKVYPSFQYIHRLITIVNMKNPVKLLLQGYRIRTNMIAEEFYNHQIVREIIHGLIESGYDRSHTKEEVDRAIESMTPKRRQV